MDKKALILVVDDNPECSALVVSTLEAHGFRTISATGGREAVEFAIEFQPRLVLMDLNMPDMDGYEATQAIHAHRRGWRIPVVVVSGDVLQAVIETAIANTGIIILFIAFNLGSFFSIVDVFMITYNYLPKPCHSYNVFVKGS